MERFCESVLALTGSLGLLLATDGRLLVMLSLTNLSDNASSRALPLESPQSTFQGFILTNTDLRHLVSLPSAQAFDDPLRQTRRQWSTVRLIIAQLTLFVNRNLHFLQKDFVEVSNIGYTQAAREQSREGWRFAKQIRPDLDCGKTSDNCVWLSGTLGRMALFTT